MRAIFENRSNFKYLHTQTSRARAIAIGLLGLILPLSISGCGDAVSSGCFASYQTESTGYEVSLNASASFGTDSAQSFVSEQTGDISNVSVKLQTIGTVSTGHTLTLTLESDSSGSPSGTALATASVLISTAISSTAGFVTFTFSSDVPLTQGTTYWIRLSPSYGVSATNAVQWISHDGSTNTYSSGALKQKNTDTSWGNGNFGSLRDGLFKVNC